MSDESIPGGRIDALRAHGAAAVAAVEQGVPLAEALTQLILAIQANAEAPMLASVLLLEGRVLRDLAGPSLPAAYREAIDGTEIGPAVGSCGTAAYYGEPVFADDIKTDPLWVDFKDVALAAGLRACWSTPIKDDTGRILGTFANYYLEPRHPRPADFEAIKALGGYVARAVVSARESA